MYNAFQVFRLEPAAYVDTDSLKKRYLALSAESHPDSFSAPDSNQFIQVQKAYECLISERLRLKCLLEILGDTDLNVHTKIPQELGDLFMGVAQKLSLAGTLLKERSEAESNLEKALLEPRILTAIEELQDTLKILSDRRTSHQIALKELQLDKQDRIKYYFIEFSYLDRWISQMQEKMFLLATPTL